MLISRSLVLILFHSISNVMRHTDSTGMVPASADAILDQALFLIMLALIDLPVSFAEIASHLACQDGLTVLQIVCKFEQHDKFKVYKSRASWILNEICKHNPGALQSLDRGSGSGSKTRWATGRSEKASCQSSASRDYEKFCDSPAELPE